MNVLHGGYGRKMLKIENVDVWGFEHAIRGMRNPLNSWDKSDSVQHNPVEDDSNYGIFGPPLDALYKNRTGFELGPNDLRLARNLFKAGTEHRKYLRQIFVSLDITAPLYWWKEFDTYKVGTVANSCSTMHKIHAKEFTLEDFSTEHLGFYNPEAPDDAQLYSGTAEDPVGGLYYPIDLMTDIVNMLNHNRNKYLETRDKTYWWQMIQLLPTSYNQKRTVTMNYENIASIIKQRNGHKLDEWNGLIFILTKLPYVQEIMGGDEIAETD